MVFLFRGRPLTPHDLWDVCIIRLDSCRISWFIRYRFIIPFQLYEHPTSPLEYKMLVLILLSSFSFSFLSTHFPYKHKPLLYTYPNSAFGVILHTSHQTLTEQTSVKLYISHQHSKHPEHSQGIHRSSNSIYLNSTFGFELENPYFEEKLQPSQTSLALFHDDCGYLGWHHEGY